MKVSQCKGDDAEMNAQWMWENDSCERLESLSSPPLSLCEIFVGSNRNAHSGCVVREHGCIVAVPRRRGVNT